MAHIPLEAVVVLQSGETRSITFSDDQSPRAYVERLIMSGFWEVKTTGPVVRQIYYPGHQIVTVTLQPV